ncbi:hypothetical protein EVAR_32818_1 [Eumeta japonica]|uniref:Uncharacterized protein n=1 Tax=Eumeta variegata TaxID=151549 RepID=A0A4C1WE28_EUMVA|nr:hypothetical protein EVAR_32818_1 [Eumeta japonica]
MPFGATVVNPSAGTHRAPPPGREIELARPPRGRRRVHDDREIAVTHPSTDHARRRLTSVIGREPVHSTWYGRWQYTAFNLPTFVIQVDKNISANTDLSLDKIVLSSIISQRAYKVLLSENGDKIERGHPAPGRLAAVLWRVIGHRAQSIVIIRVRNQLDEIRFLDVCGETVRNALFIRVAAEVRCSARVVRAGHDARCSVPDRKQLYLLLSPRLARYGGAPARDTSNYLETIRSTVFNPEAVVNFYDRSSRCERALMTDCPYIKLCPHGETVRN